jgi:hypothetical protein
VRAPERDGKLPPHLKPGERNKRIYDRLEGCDAGSSG